MTWSILHPFIVHFALSLALLFGISELFPKIKERIPDGWLESVRRLALLGLLLATLTGVMTFWKIYSHTHSLFRIILPHPTLALLGGSLFFILGMMRKRSSTTVLRILALAGIIFLLSAAALGGILVYEDHIGTDFGHDFH